MNQARFTTDEIVRATGAGHPPGFGGVYYVGVSTDTRTLAPGQLFVALVGERFDGHRFLAEAAAAGARGAVVARGAPRVDVEPGFHLFEVDDTLRAFGDLAAFHRARFPDLALLAVTGSNGKTTTKELLAGAMEHRGPGLKTEGNLNNLIGVPMMLLRLESRHRWAVIEMGMNAPGEIARLAEIAAPGVGLVTNAEAVHLEGLGDIDGVAAAKAELYAGLPDGAVAVVNLDDPRLPALARQAAGTGRLLLRHFGSSPEADVCLVSVESDADGVRFEVVVGGAFGAARPTARLGLVGRHNALNGCAALAAALCAGARIDAALEGMARVQATGRRLRVSTGPSGSLLLDDCYNANLSSTLAALATAAELAESRGGRLLAALGDMLELGTAEEEMHRALGREAAARPVHRLVAFGPRSRASAEAAIEAGLGASQVLATEEAEAAAEFLGTALEPADVLLVKGSRGMAMERIVERLEAPAEVAVAANGGGR